DQPRPEGTRLAGRDEVFDDETFNKLEALEAFAAERSSSLLDVAIGGLLAQPAVASVIAGATKPEQVRANAAAGDWQPAARTSPRSTRSAKTFGMSIAAAVVDVGWVNGLAAIRSLGRAGIRVLAIDHRPSALGFRSKYAERLVSPDPFEEEHRFVNFVRALGEVVIFPTHDNVLNAIARYTDDLDVLTPFPRGTCSSACRASGRSSSRRKRPASTFRRPTLGRSRSS